MVKSYCVKEKRITDCVPGSERYIRTKNNRLMMKCKTQFVSNQGN